MKIEKLCNFYASKYHLSMILLEYLKEKNNKKVNVITFFQDEIEDEINVLVDKYKYNVDNIKEIDFKITKNIYDKEINLEKNNIFIVEGSLEYISEANEYIFENLPKLTKAKIINCYNFSHQKLYMKEIINKSDKILFTSGEKVID